MTLAVLALIAAAAGGGALAAPGRDGAPGGQRWQHLSGAIRGPQTMSVSKNYICNYSEHIPPGGDASSARGIAAAADAAPAVTMDVDAYGAGAADFAPGALAVFRDVKGDAASAPPATVLVFLTTACAKCHLVYLQSCWPRALGATRLLAAADVLLYVGCLASDRTRFKAPGDGETQIAEPRASPWVDALRRLPNRNVSLAWTRWNPGHQAGAIAPLLVAAREAWLGGYEWVVRANPDVLFLDPAPLAARMADARSSLVAWVCRLPNSYPKWSSIPTEYFLNTDVLAARVDAINHSGWRGGRSSRPEFVRDIAEARTTLALDAATRSGGATLWAAGSQPNLCRAQSHGVFHSHQACRRSVQPSDPSATARAIEAAAACYAARYEDARALACGAGGCDGKAAALHRHYRSRGQTEGRFFGCGQTPVEALAILHEEMRDAAAACYAARYADVRALLCGSGDCDGKSDALHRHYLDSGRRENRSYGCSEAPVEQEARRKRQREAATCYAARNADLRAKFCPGGICQVVALRRHYLRFGVREGRGHYGCTPLEGGL